MCELFGFSSGRTILANDLLNLFFLHSREHPHGWGLAVFRGHAVTLEKEPVRASSSTYLEHRLSCSIEADNLLAHIRKATIGEMTYANCHPFVWDDDSGRTWTLIHNGTVFEPHLISPFFSRQEGTTDSEGVLLYLIDRINRRMNAEKKALTHAERFQEISEGVTALAACGKLNLILYDGEQMYVHSNYRGYLHYSKEADSCCFSTLPLAMRHWEPLPLNQVFGYISGELVHQGEPHPYEHLDGRHDMSLIYGAYASL